MAWHATCTTARLSVVLYAFEALQVGALDNSADAASLVIEGQEHGANPSAMLERRATGAKRSSLIRSEDYARNRQSASGHSGRRTASYDSVITGDSPIIYYRMDDTAPAVLTHVVGITHNVANLGSLGNNGTGTVQTSLHSGGINSPYWERTGLIPSDATNDAMRFIGMNDKIVLPNRTEINKNSAGYQQRSIEVWFLSDRYADTHNHFLYEEGDQYTGLAMWVHEDGFGQGRLRMFAWNTPGFIIDDQAKTPYYGHGTVNTEPLDCRIFLGITYYAAFVFDATAGSYQGYVRSEEQNTPVACGTAASLPSGSKLMWHPDVGCIGNICGHSRTGAGLSRVADTSASAAFHGTIDEVAIYNTALSATQVAAHASAGFD